MKYGIVSVLLATSSFEQKRSHFEEMDEAKQANLKAKEALCENLNP